MRPAVVASVTGAGNYDAQSGMKWSLRSLKLFMISRHGETIVNALFNNIQMLIIQSIQSVQSILIQDKHCFELYGYDVLIEDNLKPWLIEVNASPSLSTTTESDRVLKMNIIISISMYQ